MEQQIPEGLNLGDLLKYAAIVDQMIAVAKSLKGSAVGVSHQMPTVKVWIGDAYWEADLGEWKRLK